MKIMDDIISTLNTEEPVKDIRLGLLMTAVLTKYCGLSATLPQDALRQEWPLVREPGLLVKKSTREVLDLCYSKSILEAAIGLAAVNSLIEVDEKKCRVLNAREVIAGKWKDKNVAVVGHFPFVDYLRNIVKKLWVIEKNPHEGDYPESEAGTYIPQADVVAITGTAFTNHTIENLLKLCNGNAYVVILGGTAPLSPVLFDYHIDAVSGTRVVDTEIAMHCVSEGANYRQLKGILQLTMTREPG